MWVRWTAICRSIAIRTESQQIESQLFAERLIARLSSFFGLLALLLSCIGLYGLLAYEVSRRTREIGIRMALGARSGDVLRLVIGQGLALTAVGAAIGIGAALGVTRFLGSLLYGVKPADPLTFAAVALFLAAVALLACYIPARRAMRRPAGSPALRVVQAVYPSLMPRNSTYRPLPPAISTDFHPFTLQALVLAFQRHRAHSPENERPAARKIGKVESRRLWGLEIVCVAKHGKKQILKSGKLQFMQAKTNKRRKP